MDEGKNLHSDFSRMMDEQRRVKAIRLINMGKPFGEQLQKECPGLQPTQLREKARQILEREFSNSPYNGVDESHIIAGIEIGYRGHP